MLGSSRDCSLPSDGGHIANGDNAPARTRLGGGRLGARIGTGIRDTGGTEATVVERRSDHGTSLTTRLTPSGVGGTGRRFARRRPEYDAPVHRLRNRLNKKL